ncbi:uncharacterized protein G2W53_021698 [Senna tora]|uniref:Uncharacterized protein n=1 Tax=Senna tora TaxID=362788 RepID=A0A834TLS6_9FABA|nr:uncharacterized protein G2W53_021698 [Senna tora]
MILQGSFAAFHVPSKIFACSHHVSTISGAFIVIGSRSQRRCRLRRGRAAAWDPVALSRVRRVSPFYVPEEDDELVERDEEGKLLLLLRMPFHCLDWAVRVLANLLGSESSVISGDNANPLRLLSYEGTMFMMYTYDMESLGVKPSLGSSQGPSLVLKESLTLSEWSRFSSGVSSYFYPSAQFSSSSCGQCWVRLLYSFGTFFFGGPPQLCAKFVLELSSSFSRGGDDGAASLKRKHGQDIEE